MSFDLILLDINLPDVSGIDIVPQIKKVSPDTRVLLCTALVRHRSAPTIPATTSTIVAYGRVSGRMPGISPRLSRGNEDGARSRRSATRPSRSSFGARLRSRFPQYGHSVMYGLTSDPQLLQTTKRSGPPVLTVRL